MRIKYVLYALFFFSSVVEKAFQQFFVIENWKNNQFRTVGKNDQRQVTLGRILKKTATNIGEIKSQ